MGWMVLAAAPLMLAGCETSSLPNAGAPPGPITAVCSSLAANKSVDLGFSALEVGADATKLLLTTKKLTSGTPSALVIATGLDGTRDWLNKARVAQRACNRLDFDKAIDNASGAYDLAAKVIAAIQGKK